MTVVSLEKVSPVVRMYVLFSGVACMIACGGVFPSVGMRVPSSRKDSFGRAGLQPRGRKRLLLMMVR